MEINVLNDMGLYKLRCLICQLQGVNKAFWKYVDSKYISVPDPELRNFVYTVSSLIDANETLLDQTLSVTDDFINAIENYKPEVMADKLEESQSTRPHQILCKKE